jgi:hypothetical protein
MSIDKSPAIFFLHITVRERERENMREERKREGKGEGWERDVIYRESESGGHVEDSSHTFPFGIYDFCSLRELPAGPCTMSAHRCQDMPNCLTDYLWDN